MLREKEILNAQCPAGMGTQTLLRFLYFVLK